MFSILTVSAGRLPAFPEISGRPVSGAMEYEGIVVVDVGESLATTLGKNSAPAITAKSIVIKIRGFFTSLT